MPLTRLSLPESGGPKRARSIGALGPPINPGPRAPACKLSLGRQVKARGDGSGDCVVPPRVMCLLVGVLGALDPGAAARADFPAAMKDFNQGHTRLRTSSFWRSPSSVTAPRSSTSEQWLCRARADRRILAPRSDG